MPRLSPEELADLIERDRLFGSPIARTLEAAEAQTIVIPPRAKRTENTWIGIAGMLDGYQITPELFDRELWDWFAEAVPYHPAGEYPDIDHWRQFTVIELRLILFGYYRVDRWDSQQTDTTYYIPANDILDVLREKLEKPR